MSFSSALQTHFSKHHFHIKQWCVVFKKLPFYENDLHSLTLFWTLQLNLISLLPALIVMYFFGLTSKGIDFFLILQLNCFSMWVHCKKMIATSLVVFWCNTCACRPWDGVIENSGLVPCSWIGQPGSAISLLIHHC